jgi:Putative beta barrel porin-7 (BBP7)
MKKIGIGLAVSASVVSASLIALNSSANASFASCASIADPEKRLACYDKAASAPARSAKPAAAPVWSTPSNAVAATPIVRGAAPVPSASRYWFEAEGGFFGAIRNVQNAGPSAPGIISDVHVPTSPGFIGLYQQSTATPTSNGPPMNLGGGASFGWGYWLDPQHTRALESSAFFGVGYSKVPSGQGLTNSSFINTTPDVFVGLYNDTTTVNTGAIWDVVYGVDSNYRMAVPNFPYFTNFDVLLGWRYVGLDEFAAAPSSVLTRGYASAIGLPGSFGQPIIDSSAPRWYGIWNNFVGPQIGFNAERHWGSFWIQSENKVAVGATIELGTAGPTVHSATATTGASLAGIPLAVNAGTGSVTGVSGGTANVKAAFTVVPSGNLKFGYDIIPDQRSVTLAYNYLYMSDVGLIATQLPSPAIIRQGSYFMQGITLGFKEKF